MERAIQLAAQGTKAVKNNPLVGAVLVYRDRIIGEGYHKQYGCGHAEVNCIESVRLIDQKLVSAATIYITLEPCFHQGKTPPCVDLIIKKKITNVVVGTLDPNPKVGGRSISKLESLGIKVAVGILEKECKELIAPFLKYLKNQPWVQLKFAKSKYNFMAARDGQVWLSTPSSKLYAHAMRANADGIMIGTNTALIDDPALTTRLVDGDSPIRIVLDRQGILPLHLKVFNDGYPTIYITARGRKLAKPVVVLLHDFEQENHFNLLLEKIYSQGIYRLIIEGGATLFQSIVENEQWDEAIVIDTQHELQEGLKAPHLLGKLMSNISIDTDKIYIVRK